MKEIKSENDSKRRPPKALYRPPQLRRSRPTPPAGPSSSGASLPVSQQQFKLEVELQPTLWWKGVVRYGEESEHVKELQQQYDLTPQLRDALSHIIQEFTERTF